MENGRAGVKSALSKAATLRGPGIHLNLAVMRSKYWVPCTGSSRVPNHRDREPEPPGTPTHYYHGPALDTGAFYGDIGMDVATGFHLPGNRDWRMSGGRRVPSRRDRAIHGGLWASERLTCLARHFSFGGDHLLPSEYGGPTRRLRVVGSSHPWPERCDFTASFDVKIGQPASLLIPLQPSTGSQI